MKIKIFFSNYLYNFFFLYFFYFFYKGLKNSNIYTPKIIKKKKFHHFDSKNF